MADSLKLRCAVCDIPKERRACRSPEGIGPAGCPTLEGQDTVEKVKEIYKDPVLAELARQASIQEADNYVDMDTAPRSINTRIEEICQFARKMGFRKLGIAYCSGLIEEARILHEILATQGFEVYSVICKAGCVPKEYIGLKDEEKIHPGQYESMCNPVGQAEFLNEAGTDLNILMGLCVGHDSLFIKQSQAYTTIFAVKDRVMGHNPMAALYLSSHYYKRLKMPGGTNLRK